MMPSLQPKIFAIPCGANFPKSLAIGLANQFSSHPPENLARAHIIVNTRRMQRQLVDEFSKLGALLLPRIHIVTDLSELTGPLPFNAPQSALQNRFELMKLVLSLLDNQPDFAARSSLFDLTDSLATLIDEIQGEGVNPDVIKQLNVDDQSGHWQRVLYFINIVQQYLDSPDNTLDAQGFQRKQAQYLLDKWSKKPLLEPIYFAGSTGSRATTLDLIKGVFDLPNGYIVLPGFDFDLPPLAWEQMQNALTAQDHPQYRFLKMVTHLGHTIQDVTPWFNASAPNPARNKLLSLALRPAPVTDSWLEEGPKLQDLDIACQDITLLEAETPRQEALAIAMRLRKAAQEGQRVALISPDRTLTRQVSAALDRWKIVPDDSAGIPFQLSPPGRFLRQVSDILTPTVKSSQIIAILRHPICHSVSNTRGQHILLTNSFDIFLRQNSIIQPNISDLEKWAKNRDSDFDKAWVMWLRTVLDYPKSTKPLTLLERFDAHIKLAEFLAAGSQNNDENANSELWEKDAGNVAKILVQEIRAAAHGAPVLNLNDYQSVISSIFSQKEVRNPIVAHKNVLIWGTLEARVQGVDLAILSGLNEGSWPESPTPDPWMNRKMRNEAGLLLPERRIGLSAHDFQQAIGAPEVWLTRSKRSADAETVPSRWLNRLVNLLDGLKENGGKTALTLMKKRGSAWIKRTEQLEFTHPKTKAGRPAPKPPVDLRPRKLSVTEIKTLIRDPYAIYARHVLKLIPLDQLDTIKEAALKGTAYHTIFELFIRNWNDSYTHQQHLEHLQQITHDVISKIMPKPAIQQLWINGVMNFAEKFIDDEIKRRKFSHPIALEKLGSWILNDIVFELTAKVDRIDITKDGEGIIYDYKTGSISTKSQQKHFDKQLFLLAAILEQGAFLELPPTVVKDAYFLPLKSNASPTPAPFAEEDLQSAIVKFQKLIETYFDGNVGYRARRALFKVADFSPYDTLSRYGEWDVTDDYHNDTEKAVIE